MFRSSCRAWVPCRHRNTIAIRSQIDGKLKSVDFVEGQEVHKGDTLAVIDPRALQAALDQAVAKKAQDQAQLVAAQKDLGSLQDAGAQERGNPAERRLPAGQGRSAQGHDRCRSGRDRKRADAAFLCHHHGADRRPRRLPPGRRRQHHPCQRPKPAHGADPDPPGGGDLHAAAEGLWRRCASAMLRGSLPVLAFDQDNDSQLAAGELLLVDNQIDQTTSTIRLKASFPNKDDQLWPGEFVRCARSGRHPQERRDHPAGGAAARAAGLLCLGHQGRQYRRATADRSRRRSTTRSRS